MEALKKTLVIVRYQEDIGWSNQFPDVSKTIIQKGGDFDYGREASGFFKFIIDNYDTLEGYYYFFQGNPFDHCPNCIQSILGTPSTPYQEFGQNDHQDDKNGCPCHPGLKVGWVYEELYNKPSPELFGFKAGGGQFVVHTDRIKVHPKSFYEKGLQLCKDYDNAPWCFERLWRTIFNGNV
jgi:hypothetical protein